MPAIQRIAELEIEALVTVVPIAAELHVAELGAGRRKFLALHVEQDAFLFTQQGERLALAGQPPLQVEVSRQEGIGEAQVEVVERHAYRIGQGGAHHAVRLQGLRTVVEREIVDPDMLVFVKDRRRGELPGMSGHRQVGRQDIRPHFVSFPGGVEECELGVELTAVPRTVVIAETRFQVEERTVGRSVERDIVGDQRTRLDAVDVHIGQHPFAFGVDPQLRVVQEDVPVGQELRRETALDLVVDQVDADAAAL